MIDLRSDTITKPDAGMLDAMMSAKVGDDVFGEDETTNELQEFIADMFGKEAALFISSGTMGNQLAVKILTEPGDEIIVESQSHIFFYETAAPSVISRVQMKTIDSERGMMSLNDIENAVRPDIYYFPKTSMIALENTHNRHSGTVLSKDYIKEVGILAEKYNLKLHLDGARLWNAIAATGIEAKQWAEYFDTVTVCFSKGLGAPVGSMLMSTKENIEKARKWRKILGGGMRQTGILAAAAMYAVKNNFDKIAADNENAQYFAELIAQSEKINVDLSRVETNIVYFDYSDEANFTKFVNNCQKKGLLFIPTGKTTARAVFHLHISREDTEKAANILLDSVM